MPDLQSVPMSVTLENTEHIIPPPHVHQQAARWVRLAFHRILVSLPVSEATMETEQSCVEL